jgi:hypothetical protein
MRKTILPLQIITIVGMIISMIIMFNADSNDTIIKSITTFIGFGCVGVVAIILDEKLKKKTTI